MITWRTDRDAPQPGLPARGLGSPAGRGALVGWAVAVGLGSVLGAYVLIVATRAPQLLGPMLLAVLVPLALIVIGNVRRTLLAVIILDIPLQLDMHLGFRPEVASMGALGGLNLSATSASLLILYALWAMEGLARVGAPPRPRIVASLPLVLYVALVALSTLVARDRELAGFEVFLLCQMLLLFIYVASWVRKRDDVVFVMAVLVVGLALESAIMLFVYLTGVELNLLGISTTVNSVYGDRVGGTLRSPNSAAAYLSMLLVPTASLLLSPGRGWLKSMAAVACGLGVLALILTLSRGGWLAFALSAALFGFLAWRRGWVPLRFVAGAAILAMLVLALFQGVVFGRLLDDDGGTAIGRIPLMKLASAMIRDHPLSGVGANNFAAVVGQYAGPEYNMEWVYTVHNKYFLVWAEVGLMGLLAFLMFLATTFARGVRSFLDGDSLLAPLALGLTAALFGHLYHMFVDIFNMRPQVQLLWLIAALVTGMQLQLAGGDGLRRGSSR